MTADQRKLKERVHAILATNKMMVFNSLLALYEKQSLAERAGHATAEDNGEGFTKHDAEILTSFAEQVKRGRGLSGNQMAICRKRLPKYWRQIGSLMSPIIEQEIQQAEQRNLFEGTW